jgi:hypothetical protein
VIERSGGAACETVRWQQYFVLSRIVDQAWDRSQEGVKEFASRTIENSAGNGNPRLSGRTVTQHFDAGDVRYLETAMAALKEIRELFCIGAAAESGPKGTFGERDFTLEALVKIGAVRITTSASTEA